MYLLITSLFSYNGIRNQVSRLCEARRSWESKAFRDRVTGIAFLFLTMVSATTKDSSEFLLQYDRLTTPTSIRLVKFESSFEVGVPTPGVDALYGPDFRWIRCSCEAFDLAEDRCPNYYGLSYTWGYPFHSNTAQSHMIDHSVGYDKLTILL
jgi:hypothetical protein